MAKRKEDEEPEVGKDAWSLLPWDAVEGVVKVLTFGLTKHPDADGVPYWKTLDGEEHFSALMRHLVEWKNGKRTDEETGMPSLWHAGARMLFLIWSDL